LRDVTRHRARMVRGQASAKISFRALLARHNLQPLYKYPFGPRGLYRLLRSWPLDRRSGRVPALPYPPPRSTSIIATSMSPQENADQALDEAVSRT
jgi:hypothetical protein